MAERRLSGRHGSFLATNPVPTRFPGAPWARSYRLPEGADRSARIDQIGRFEDPPRLGKGLITEALHRAISERSPRGSDCSSPNRTVLTGYSDERIYSNVLASSPKAFWKGFSNSIGIGITKV